MKKHTTALLPFVGLCLLSSAVNAASLVDVYTKAKASDPQLLSAAASFQSSAEDVVQAKAALRPNISGELNAKLQDSAASERANSQGYSINLTQPIYSPALGSALERVEINDQIAKLRYQQSEQNLIVRTVDAYIAAMTAKSNLTTAIAREKAIKRRLDQARVEFDVGVIAITDVHEAKASYDNARVDRIVREGELENSYQSLQRLSGEAINNVDTLDSKYPIEHLEPLTSSYWVERASEGNLALIMAEQNIEASSKDTAIAKSDRRPNLELQASHSGSEDSERGWSRDSQLSLVLNVPIYQGGALNSKVRQSLSAQEVARQNYQDNLREVTQTTRRLVRDIETNILAIAARKQSIVSSQAALNAVNEGFKAGTRNIVDLLQAEDSLFSARNNYATARLEQVRLLLSLKFQTGEIAEQDIQDIAKWMQAQ
ncbi:MAG: TolC family outer membrane protein [Pseudomonadales bacterium]